MPVNANPDYVAAEARYHSAQTMQEKIKFLEEMIAKAPKHKSSENLQANLKTRYKKFKSQVEKSSKKSGSGKAGIKKSDMQAVILGKTNSGKSSLLKSLTNTKSEISQNKFTTKTPEIGMANCEGVQLQLIENPAIDSEYFDRGLLNSADTFIILIESLEDLPKLIERTKTSKAKTLIAFNKIDLLNESENRKVSATLKSKKYNYVLISTKTEEGIPELKEKLFQTFNKIRVYTKEPKENKDKVKKERPIILNPDSTIKDVAEKILHSFSKQVTETRIWGPSSKFPGQTVGMKHKVKDLDLVEFKTR